PRWQAAQEGKRNKAVRISPMAGGVTCVDELLPIVAAGGKTTTISASVDSITHAPVSPARQVIVQRNLLAREGNLPDPSSSRQLRPRIQHLSAVLSEGK